MAVYAIGDIQGCYEPLQALLRKIRFDPARDRLWFTGDLVNRGPQSAQVLRFVRGLGRSAITVLGNHDLHALARAAGATSGKYRDTIDDILHAPDREELLGWLRERPLLHHDSDLGFTLVHAGLLPQWDLAVAQACAREVETVLRGVAAIDFFSAMYGDKPNRWDERLSGWERLRLIVNAFTRLRYCDRDGRVDLSEQGPLGTQARDLFPWFQVPGRNSVTLRLVFGHWASLGIWNADGVIGLDSGCVWGNALTAVRLDGAAREFISVSCPRVQALG